MVPHTDTVVNPGTVVVETSNATVTGGTVFGTKGSANLRGRGEGGREEEAERENDE